MRYITGTSRQQTLLLPPSIDELIPEEHPVRVIDAYIDSLDFSILGFTHSHTCATGRKPYHPGDLLKLYIYAYLNQTSSSRMLEKECHRNIEVMWLLNRLAPDFKTIADFRKDNGAAIKRVCRTFIVFCRQVGLVSGILVAIDGSKFKAAASKDSVITQKQLNNELGELDRKIEYYLTSLNQSDEETHSPAPDASRAEQALAHLQAVRSSKQQLFDKLREQGDKQYCDSEPEARLMRSGRCGMIVGYNAQNAVDSQHQLIIHHELSQEGNDARQLKPMVDAVNTVLNDAKTTIIADSGYSNGEQVAQSQRPQTTVIVPAKRGRNRQAQFYQRSDFTYLADADAYRCPAGKSLVRKTISTADKLVLYARTGCQQCQLQSKCTKADTRWVSRHFYEQAMEQANQLATPSQMRKRMSIVEPPFGTLKRLISHGRFCCWGKAAAESEYSLGVLSYNLLRVMKVVGVKTLINQLA